MSDSTDSQEALNPGADLTVQDTAPRWLDVLNSFLERAYLQADQETGC
jgi:hypothetical protein